jgi:hypothetical protein
VSEVGGPFRGLQNLRSGFGAEVLGRSGWPGNFENLTRKNLCDGAQKMRENDGTENTSTDERPRSSVSGGKRRPG